MRCPLQVSETRKQYTITSKSQAGIRSVVGNLTSCCGTFCSGVSMWFADRLAQLIQVSMGLSAATAAYALSINISQMKIASSVIVVTCTFVQTCDSLSFVLIELFGLAYWATVRARINQKKDAFEDACVDAAAELIGSTRTFAAMTARNARRVMHSSNAGGVAVDVPLGDGEKWMLSKVDEVGELMRGSPIKCLISTLNLTIFLNGYNAHASQLLPAYDSPCLHPTVLYIPSRLLHASYTPPPTSLCAYRASTSTLTHASPPSLPSRLSALAPLHPHASQDPQL